MGRKGIDSLIDAKKVLLHMSVVPSGTPSGPQNGSPFPSASPVEFSAIYEIVIFNNSKYNVDGLSVKDSFMGLYTSTISTNLSNTSSWNELAPYLTNVTVDCVDKSIKSNSFIDIMNNKGELLKSSSSMAPYSVCNLIVRMTGRGRLSTLDPITSTSITTGPLPSSVAALPLYMNNSAIVKGSFACTCGCGSKIFRPLYIKDDGFKPNINLNFELNLDPLGD
jgi:hypothetical protein